MINLKTFDRNRYIHVQGFCKTFKLINFTGVITQYVACEFEVDDFQEGLLGCILYLTMGMSAFFAGPISTR